MGVREVEKCEEKDQNKGGGEERKKGGMRMVKVEDATVTSSLSNVMN